MKFATVIYTQDVRAALAFYERAFGLATRFYDETYAYGELDVEGAILGIGSHSLGELVMPGAYRAAEESDRGTWRLMSGRWPRARLRLPGPSACRGGRRWATCAARKAR